MTADRIGDDELADWLRLTQTPGVGPTTCRALLAAFGLPDAVLDASREQLVRVVPAAVADAVRQPASDALKALIAATQAWSDQPGNHVVTLADSRYPALLLETTDPPAAPLRQGTGRAAECLDARDRRKSQRDGAGRHRRAALRRGVVGIRPDDRQRARPGHRCRRP